jgi:succinate-acetate transporter protein
LAETATRSQSTTPTGAPAPATASTGLADPAPLGLAAFALTTFVLSVFNAGLIGTGETVVLGLALAYGGIGQFAAGMWEFVRGNTFGALAFGSFGGFWISFWWLIEHLPADAKGRDLTHGLGVYLLAWAIFTGYMFVASLRVSVAVMAVFLFLTLTFLFLAIGAFVVKTGATTVDGWTKVGGWLGLITAVLAWYASFAGVTNSTFKRTVLPTMPR